MLVAFRTLFRLVAFRTRRISHTLRIMERTLFPLEAALQLNITLTPAHWEEIAQERLPYFDIQRFVRWFLRRQSKEQRPVITKKSDTKREGQELIPTVRSPCPYFFFSFIRCVRGDAPSTSAPGGEIIFSRAPPSPRVISNGFASSHAPLSADQSDLNSRP